jgi:hypothetical protein
MIIKTKIEWLKEIELTEEEKTIIEAKRAVLGGEYIPEDIKYDAVTKDAIIDVKNKLLFVQVEQDEICVTKLLESTYVSIEGGVQKLTDRQYFKGDLEELYNILKD